MHKYRAIIILVLLSGNLQPLQAKTISLTCPEPTSQSITITKQPYDESWRAYQYQGIIPVDLPSEGNQLLLMGQGSENSVHSMSVATWTDSTFLCWYEGDTTTFVIYTLVDFEPYFERCYFFRLGESECFSSQPKDCPLLCELKNSKP